MKRTALAGVRFVCREDAKDTRNPSAWLREHCAKFCEPRRPLVKRTALAGVRFLCREDAKDNLSSGFLNL